MRDRFMVYMFALFLFLSWPLLISGQDVKRPYESQPAQAPQPHPPPSEPVREIKAPPLKMITPGVFEIGSVRILKKEGKVEFPAAVNMDKGLLEYLIVGGTGKLHESLLRTEVEPYSIQIALLMIGLEGTTNPLAAQGDPRTPEGDPVSIWVRWGQAGQARETRIEKWVFNEQKKGPMEPIQWIFTGSYIYNGVFMAQVEKSIVAVFHDPVAIIDNPLPDGASDEIWFVNEGKVPAVGTEVAVVVKKEPK
jgi:hypothetical protein